MERRKFLALVGGGVSLSSFPLLRDSPDYKDSQAALRELAKTVDKADLADPRKSSQLIRDIEESLRKSKTGLHSGETKRARKVADIVHSIDQAFSVLPWVSPPPAKPPIENKIAAVKAASSYYATLLSVFKASEDLRGRLASVNLKITDGSNGMPNPLNFENASTGIDNSLSNLQREENQLPDSTTEILSQMLPTRDQVLTEVSQLREVYARYSEVQQDYIVASKLINTATLKRENQELQNAKQMFSKAASSIDSSIPEEIRSYSLGWDSIPLGSYQKILQAYEEGIPLLERACDDPQNLEKSPNRLFGAGLGQLFDARQIVESATTWG